MTRFNLTSLFIPSPSQYQRDKENVPTYVAIVTKKDGTAVAKCLNSYGGRRRSSSSVSSEPLKKRFATSANIFSRLKQRRTSSESSLVACTISLTTLPAELVHHILYHLNCRDIIQLSCTSHHFRRLCFDNHLWQSLFFADFFPTSKSFNFYQAYRDQCVVQRRWLRGEVATRYFKGHQDNIYCLAWVGPNKVASGSRDRAICIWDLQTGQCTRFDSGHTGSVLCMRASRDYSILLTGSSDATCKIWSLPDCRLLLTFRGHGHGVLDVCVIQDYIVTSSRDHTIRVWDKTGRELRQLTGHTGSVNALEPLDDRRVISASGDSTLKVWDITTGQCLRTMKGHTYGLACVRYDGERIYSGGQDSQIRVWDPETGECLMTMSGHMNLIRTMDCFDGKLVSGSYDRTLRVWDTKTGACLLSFQSGHSSWIFNVLLSRTKIVSAGQDRRIMMLDFAQGIQTAKLFKEIL